MPTGANRWTPITRFPLTKRMNDRFPTAGRKRTWAKSEIVNEALCDDILNRVSPYLNRKSPIDILDLWPGVGLFSSKANDLLKPRRHVMIEPLLDTYGPFLKPLVASKPSYDLISLDIHSHRDWDSVISKHLPEQGPSSGDSSGTMTKNDTLLVLASPPPNTSKRNHYTPSRWWSIFLEMCMRQAGFHNYGCVRLLATLPSVEVQNIIPRSVVERKRPALLTESLALHAFELASPMDSGSWTMTKGWDVMTQNAARVSERTAANKIQIPPGREPRAYTLAPESPETGWKPAPYTPRVRTDKLEQLMKLVEGVSKTSSDRTAKQKRSRALIQLNQDNRHAYIRAQLKEKRIQIDQLTKSLSQAAANPKTTSESLKQYTDQIAALSSKIEEVASENHYDTFTHLSGLVDDHRASLHTGNFDDALLHWDRRPFEPLHIDPEELFPQELDRTVLYFEPDANSPAMQIVKQVDTSKRSNFFQLFEFLTLAFNTRGSMPVSELLTLMFPTRPLHDLIRVIPSLATYAGKKPKPDFDSIPKPLPSEVDPSTTYQENIDYDLSEVRLRSLPVLTMWELTLEYMNTAADKSPVHLNRLLGGSLTSFRTGDYRASYKRLN
ncbi:uncharacterized protein EURHEDRAFT_463891 [Aspergillus ruber CBS 135680]|uniref:rRNA adenine N(6)-methyltransferase n=1 Tax=Aspergillus ruber (strain CBS 135680) TaxID=1388766 RepID=A0A017S5L6_ASPRC|nr:uncharacterized protein EURHEDRAFT_463891 [Aspergillus ruber CBS 135680]EYE91924.1 hypothetical protein EURHEDRAFT_463891 [Aspergillus ruber CBS 135680]